MQKKIFLAVIKFSVLFEFIVDKFWSFFIKKAMGHSGRNVTIKPSTSLFKGIENFYFEDDIMIGKYSIIYSTLAKVKIGKKVITAPNLKIITGNHRIDMIGHFMFDGTNNQKIPENDKDVIIEGDTWIGINVTILSGVTIGRGSVISAGAILTTSFPPYSIVVGVPGRLLKYRFTIDEVLEHEKLLYDKAERLSREDLIKTRLI